MSLEASGAAADEDEDVPMPGAFSTAPPLAQPKFVFGSPSPQPAPFSFTAAAPSCPIRDEDADAKKVRLAAEVTEEMNRQVFGEGTPPPAARVIRPLGSAKKSLGGEKSGVKAPGRFDKAHESVWADGEYCRRGGEEAGTQAQVERGECEATGKDDKEVDAQKQEKTQAEKEAVRRKLEASRARRRSSVAAGGARRTSGRVSGVLVKPKPKPGRFGFFAGAAKLVQGVWGKKATPAPLGAGSMGFIKVEHARNPVLFQQAVAKIKEDNVFRIEILIRRIVDTFDELNDGLDDAAHTVFLR
ncbi:hypothetical protein C8F04DRAFT_1294084 [Mycena alexandri]|uniref:Uncharacterized protein n=1 Tax=Mycena alexandri TaxID=1745969 RepID=A0AAD6SI96_9AGAR|nr:hypothetical protein C8F04DRAFT_1294084 [Mycena alexandri]